MGQRLLEPPALAGLATILVSGWVLVWRWGPIAAGHPSYLIFYFVAILLGVVGVLVVERRRGPRSAIKSSLSAFGLVVVSFAAWWLAPFPADQVALDVLEHPVGFEVTESASSIRLRPEGEKSGTSLSFYPGARVDARAYAGILSPLARDGIDVTILKPPLGIAFLVFGVTRPDTQAWVVGGHSLGGVAASGAADRGADGLLLWASFPASNISANAELNVSSIYGTEDAFATPTEVTASATDLPPETVFVAVQGAIHSFFGDYGLQPGDGTPTVDRDQAQTEIIDASLDLLHSLSGP
jgi:Alpha/beta hydrolase family